MANGDRTDMSKQIRIRQVKSVIGRLVNQKRTIEALGIRKRGRAVVHNDTPAIRGMINTVKHLVEVEEV